ncbi:MAG: IclR family transcriptional regulator [Desulfobacteraceae bacterium]|nr:IclR family transcriptional regulator [Desulfobacteraceae bacterium]
MSIQSVDRALTILSLFSSRCPVLGVTDISRAVGLSKGTVHGLIRTLVRQGFLQQDGPTRKYRLGLKIYELGMILAGTLEINQKATGPVNQMVKSTQLVGRVAIWDGDSVVITSQVHPRPRAVISHQFGPRVHAYCSALGKAVLAFLEPRQLEDYLKRTSLVAFTSTTVTRKDLLRSDLETARRQGFAIDREEAVQGVGCIGAPVFHYDGQVAGSISLSGAMPRVLGDKLAGLAEEVIRTAAEISRYLGYLPPFADTLAGLRPAGI